MGIYRMKDRFKNGNCVRYLASAQKADNRRWFTGLPYHRKGIEQAPGRFVAGVGVGLVKHLEDDVKGHGLLLNDGGHIIRTIPDEQYRVPDVRDFHLPNSDRVRKYVDFATFKQIGEEMFVGVYGGERKMVIEVSTGVKSREAADQLQAWNKWHALIHGSVALVGPKLLVVTSANKTLKTDLLNPNKKPAHILSSEASLRQEQLGEMVGDCPLWISRVWEVEYTARGDSQAILVRQFGEYKIIVARPGEVEDLPAPAAEYSGVFEKAAFDQKLIPMLPAVAA